MIGIKSVQKVLIFLVVVYSGFAAASAWAGGGPHNILIVVNDNSDSSRSIGQYYRVKRGIPSRNICHISVTTSNDIDMLLYSNQVQAVVHGYINSAGLSNQIDYIVFSRDIPYRVVDGLAISNHNEGITSVMFYGHRDSHPGAVPGPHNSQDYYACEHAFSRQQNPSSNRYYLSTLLTCYTEDETRRIIDHATQADYSNPTGTVYLVHTSLFPYNVRWPQFTGTDFLSRFLELPQSRVIEESNSLTGKVEVSGCAIGYPALDVFPNTYSVGAIADHLTSYGGSLFDSGGQTSILDWLKAGCVGSYGTLIEPNAYTNKFPQTRLHYWYGRGFSMGESYYMSVQCPFQGVVVGDPMCRPYAQQAWMELDGLDSGQTLSNTVSVCVTGHSARVDLPLHRVDWLVDGLLMATATNIQLSESNIVTVSVNGTNRAYSVQAGDSIYDVAQGIKDAINAPPDLGVTARAHADRIELRQDALGVPGAYMTCTASSSTVGANQLTTRVHVPHTNFLETAYSAEEVVQLVGSPVSGDVIRAIVTRTDGMVFTNESVAGAGATADSLMQGLMDAVNSDTNLQDTTGCEVKFKRITSIVDAIFVSRTQAWNGASMHLDYSVIKQPGSGLSDTSFSDNFNDNAGVLGARATVFISCGHTNLQACFDWDTTSLGDGPHELSVIAFEGTAVGTQSRLDTSFFVSNHTVHCSITTPGLHANIPLGSVITSQVEAADSGGSVTQVSLFVEGKFQGATNIPPWSFVWNSDDFGPGQLEVQARAFSDAGGSALSEIRDVRIYQDIDGDGLPGWWEYRYFGGQTNATPHGDPDGDTADNTNEFGADTNPTNSSRFFHVTLERQDSGLPVAIEFMSSIERLYEILLNDGDPGNTNAWFPAQTNLFYGSPTTTAWTNGPTDGPSTTNTTRRYYRIRAALP